MCETLSEVIQNRRGRRKQRICRLLWTSSDLVSRQTLKNILKEKTSGELGKLMFAFFWTEHNFDRITIRGNIICSWSKRFLWNYSIKLRWKVKFITLFFGKWDIFCSSAWLILNGGNIELVFGMQCTGRKLGRKLFREIIWMRTKTFQSTQLGVEIKCSKKKTIPSPFLCFIKIIYSAQVSVLNWYLVWSHGASQEVHGLEKQKFPLCDFFQNSR